MIWEERMVVDNTSAGKESLLFLSTRNSVTNLNYNPEWNLNAAIQYGDLKDFTISLVSAEFANSVYPINSFNKYFYFEETGPLYKVIELPHNNYTGAQMATTLASLMTAASTETYTASFDSQSQKLRIESTATFLITGGLYNCNDELGFEFFNNATFAISDNPINLAGSAFVDLVCNVATNNYTVGLSKTVLTRIPINVNFGSHVYHQAMFPTEITLSDEGFRYLYCQLLDDKGNLWPLPRNTHLSLTFKITKK